MAETVVDPGVRKLSPPALIATPAVQIVKISQDWFIFTLVFLAYRLMLHVGPQNQCICLSYSECDINNCHLI